MARRESAARAPLNKLVRPRLFEQLADELLGYIHREQFQRGDRLPAERELAAQLGVSRATLSQALVALQVQGIVDVVHGGGSVLLDIPAGRRVVDTVRARRNRLVEVIEARGAMETSLARHAASRRTDADLTAIGAALDSMEADVERGGLGVDGDERFHAAVTAAGHSGLLAELMGEISELVRETRVESLSQPGRPHHSLAGHRRIAEAIRAGDPVAAALAMAEHIDLVSDVALLRKDSAPPTSG